MRLLSLLTHLPRRARLRRAFLLAILYSVLSAPVLMIPSPPCAAAPLDLSGSLQEELILITKRPIAGGSSPTSFPLSTATSLDRSGTLLTLEIRATQPLGGGNAIHASGRFFHSTTSSLTSQKGIGDVGYLDLLFQGKYALRLGKERYIYGPGIVWNPTDLQNPSKDPFDPGREKEGVFGARVDLPLREGETLTLMGIPRSHGAELSGQRLVTVKYHKELQNCDYHLSVTLSQSRPAYALAFSGIAFENWEYHGEMAWLKEPVPFPGLPGKGEAWKVLLGVRHTFPGDLFFLMEGLYNGEGLSRSQFQWLTRSSSPFTGQPLQPSLQEPIPAGRIGPSLRQQYLFASLSRPNLPGDLSASLGTLWNLDDPVSFILLPSLEYTGLKNLTVGIEWRKFIGPGDSEFGSLPITGILMARGTLHF